MNTQGMIKPKGFCATFYVSIVIFVFYFGTGAQAQSFSVDSHYWSDVSSVSHQARSGMRVQTRSARHLALKFDSFSNLVGQIKEVKPGFLDHTGVMISLPLPDGTFGQYKVAESPVMAEKLAKKYPQIKTYAGQGVTDRSSTIRFDITPKGFHAMILEKDQIIYIDPAYENNTDQYIAYYKRDFIRHEHGFTENTDFVFNKEKNTRKKNNNASRLASSRASGGELRTYRLAVAATGEYTNFHGGSANAVAAIASTMNRVNGIYEREVAIKMILINENDQIIYTDPATDPYPSNTNDLNILLRENQNNLDDVIGTDNYDIGHIFTRGGGGLASLGSVCVTNAKAMGITGTNTPRDDPFNVDYVAHEIGHQFGARHTFNGTAGSCNDRTRSGLTSFEPGSGTTIMGYAGICGPQNIQDNSNDYFHTASYDEIIEFTTNGAGSGCASITETGNTPPTVEAGDNYFIPVNTPFTLTGTANDTDGDPLTYCWEQFDLGPARPPNDPNTTGPLFRSFPPVNSPSRTFPQLTDILNDKVTLGEILPAIERTMTFRLTVRDNKSGGSGVNYDDMTVNVVDVNEPFEITSLNQGETLQSGFPENILWEVAGTNAEPINTQLVNILLSTDGGLTFPVLLAENVANDGFETVIFPDNPTNQARIKIEAVDNIFFDINDQDFSIELPVTPGFDVITDPISSAICSSSEAIFNVEIIPVLGFNEPVNLTANNLPDGAAASFDNNPVIPGNSTTLTISNTGGVVPGDYLIEVASSAGVLNNQNEISLSITSSNPDSPQPSSPANEGIGVPLFPLFTWVDNSQIHKFTFELALDQDFNNIVTIADDLTESFYQANASLESNVTYYWRVKGSNSCGDSEYSETFSFTTLIINYFTFTSTDVPKTINALIPNTIESTLEIDIENDMVITDVNVINLTGVHTYIKDLRFILRSPEGTEVELFGGICDSEDNFDLSLDDEAVNTEFACPPVDGEAYRPENALSQFNGENAKGTWTLIVEDVAPQDGGELISWGLEIGTGESPPVSPVNLVASPQSVSAVDLTWEDRSNNEDNFIVERSTLNNLNFEEVATLNANSQAYTDEGLIPETNYFYRVKAVNEFGESPYSSEVETGTLPVAPVDLTATALSESR